MRPLAIALLLLAQQLYGCTPSDCMPKNSCRQLFDIYPKCDDRYIPDAEALAFCLEAEAILDGRAGHPSLWCSVESTCAAFADCLSNKLMVSMKLKVDDLVEELDHPRYDSVGRPDASLRIICAHGSDPALKKRCPALLARAAKKKNWRGRR